MEHPKVMKKQKIYTWHAGAPNDQDFISAQNELINKIKIIFNKKLLPLPKIININDKKKLHIFVKIIYFFNSR